MTRINFLWIDRTKGNSHNKLLDFIRGIAIILVLLGHCIQYGSGEKYLNTEMFFGNLMFKFIYSFHMPLFMLVSGYLFYFTINKNSVKQLMINRIQRILIRILMWGGVSEGIVILENIIKKKQITIQNIVVDYSMTSFFNLWFLWAIFYCSIAVIIVRNLFKDNIIIYFLGILLTLILPDNLNMHMYKYMYPYFVVSYLFNKYQDKIITLLSNFKEKLILLISGLIYILLLSSYRYDSYIYNTGITLLGKNVKYQLETDLYRWLIGLVGSVFIILVLKYIYINIMKNKINELIVIFGMNSLGIYILNGYLNQYLLTKVTSDFSTNYVLTIIETVIILLISCFIIYVIKKIPVANKLLLGGR